MNIEAITEFLGWCCVINIGLMSFQSLMLIALRKKLSTLYQRMFGLDETSTQLACFQYLAVYKILVIVFNLVPYLALKIMAGN